MTIIRSHAVSENKFGENDYKAQYFFLRISIEFKEKD